MGLDGRIMYSLDAYNDMFVVESRTGVIRLRNNIDRETTAEMQLVLLATDMSEENTKTGTTVVQIIIQDSNDNPPICQESTIAVTVIPPMHSGDTVLSLSCLDKDSGSNAKLNYLIMSGNINFDFAISSTGELVLTRSISSSVYRLQIKVTDNGDPALETDVVVLVSSGGIPTIENLPGTVYLSESLSIGEHFLTLKGRSISQQVVYTIDSISVLNTIYSELSTFKIDSRTGKVFLWRELDREQEDTYLVTVTVKDLVSGIENSEAFHIQVLDSNDNEPTFLKPFYNISVMENIQKNSFVLTLSATDFDIEENAKLKFDIAGNEAGVFKINDQGHLTTSSSIDREQFEGFELIVTATDNGTPLQLTGSTSVIISVLDADEYSPEFVNVGANLEIAISENTPLAAKVIAMKATDLDVDSKIIYELDSVSKEMFFIDRNTGEIFLTRFLDRESQAIHIVIVTATVRYRSVTATISVIVRDVNDNAPSFESGILNFKVNQTAPVGSVVGSFIVTDPDFGDNAKIRISITSGNMNGQFNLIHRNDENVSTLILAQHLQYENLNRYVLTIEAVDHGVPQLTSTLSILVEVIPEYTRPNFIIDIEIIHIAENIHPGKGIYDADATLHHEKHKNDIIYTITKGNEDNVFSINTMSGEVYVSRATREQQGSVFLNIQAENVFDINLKDHMTLKIMIDDVNDHTPTFADPEYLFEIPETASIGTSLGVVFANDADKENNAFVNYGFDIEDVADAFRIDTFTGVISLKIPLDYNNVSRYEFRVTAFDHGVPSLTGTAIVAIEVIDVNNNIPAFEPTVKWIRISENTKPGKTIFKVKAYDSDTGLGGKLEYHIVKGNDQGMFNVDFESGSLKLLKGLDRELVDMHELVIEANDKAEPFLTGTLTLNVAINDVNDNTPMFEKFQYYLSVNRFAAVGTHVTTVKAFDIDKNRNAEVEYRIEASESSQLFEIDTRYGHLVTFSDISELPNQIELRITVIDKGIPRLHSESNITIEVIPPMQHSVDSVVLHVSEYAITGTFVGALNASSTSTFVMANGNFNDSFFVTEVGGGIFVNKGLDRETYPHYFLLVKSISKTSARLWTDIYVHIVVTDENDNAPVFDKPIYHLNALEHSPVGYEVGFVSATDADIGNNGNLTMSISETDLLARRMFKIDSNGVVTIISGLSFDVVKQVNFSIYAVDNGMPARSASAQILVSVVNIDECVNEHYTQAKYNIINFEIPMDVMSGYKIGCLNKDYFAKQNISNFTTFIKSDADSFLRFRQDTNCIVLNDDQHIWQGDSIVEWIVALNSPGPGTIALIRVDTFVPSEHVLILTHAITSELLELNK